MEQMNQHREQFASRLGVLAAAAGSAIGLGNIWKFPYITGMNGGAAFILVYLGCVLLVGIPIMIAEFTIGRHARKNAIGSFKVLAPNSQWYLTGWIGILSAFTILSFYSVVAGWCIAYLVKSFQNIFTGLTPAQIGASYESFTSSIAQPIIYQLVFMFLTGAIVYFGIKNGIERYSKVMMPALFILIIILDIRALTLPNAMEGLKFLFQPDFSALTPASYIAALGHSFFTLSLGMGAMITYGSYIDDKENLTSTSLMITAADTVIALLAGIAIFPAVFAFGIEPASGPGLVFVTLPNVFLMIPGGYYFSILFFGLLGVAALTSSISMLEVLVAYFSEELKLTRGLSTVIATALTTIIGIICALANTPILNQELFGLTFFELMDWISANFLLPLGGLLTIIFFSFFLNKLTITKQLTGKTQMTSLLNAFFFVVKFITPVLITIVFLSGLGIIKF